MVHLEGSGDPMKTYGLVIHSRYDVESHTELKAQSIKNLRARLLKEYRNKIPAGGRIDVVTFNKDGYYKRIGEVTKSRMGCNWYAIDRKGHIVISKINPDGSLTTEKRY